VQVYALDNVFIGNYPISPMKKEGKNSSGKVKLIYNKNLFIGIVVLILILAIIVIVLSKNNSKNPIDSKVSECYSDSECVPDSCCHATKCVSIDKKPDCKNKICSMDCESVLDCGIGRCSCIQNKCEVIKIN